MKWFTAQSKMNVNYFRSNFNLNTIIVVVLALAFVTFDMMVSLISISEFLLVPLLPVLFFKAVKHFKPIDWAVIIGIIVFVLLNTVLQWQLNDDFFIKPAIYGSIKISFYTVLFFSGLRFIENEKLEITLLNTNNTVALIVLVIGLYINFAIYSETLPFEFLWRFLRTDDNSYYLRGTDNLIRMRSLFNEPAHLGFYLNTIIGINLFNELKKPLLITNCILVLGVMLTFSFSSIMVLAVILSVYALKQLIHKEVPFKLVHLILVGITFMIIIVIFWEWLELSVLTRFQEILSGEDNSALERIFGSWGSVSKESLVLGMGIGNAPILFNNYAYILTEMGIVAFTSSIIFSIFILYKNIGLGVLLILLNFQKGGYLSASFTLSILFIYLVVINTKKDAKINTKTR